MDDSPRSFCALLAGLAFGVSSACAPVIPATAPPQLAHTPGAWIVIADSRVDTGVFRFDYPRSWRIVRESAAASATIQIVAVAPDGGAVTLAQADAIDPLADAALELDAGAIVNVTIARGDESSARFEDQARQLIASLRISAPD